MRGISLLVLVLGVVFVGYLNVRSVEEHVPADPQRKGTAEQVEQVQDTLQQYQEKLDKQAESQ